MKILHISQPKISKKNSISGIKTVLLEEIKWENSNLKIESKIYALNKIEENEELYINNFSYKIDILRYLPDFVIFDGFYIFSHLKIAKFLKKME